MTTEKLHFKTSSGIKSIVGRDLITDKFVAIFELVKNSYDAGAKKVTITFENSTITILDDGHGMSKGDLVNKWLNLAYSEKKEGTLSQSERVYVGSKGIGRFSADRLGKRLEITTKVAEELTEHKILVDWEYFDKNLKILFEDVELEYTFFSTTRQKDASFTKIKIFDLYEIWSEDDIDKAKESLRRLKNPFIMDDGFQILFVDKTGLIDKREVIKNDIQDVLKNKSITVEAVFSKQIEVSLFDRGEKIYEVISDNLSILRDCPIKISINYLTTSSKINFTKKMKIEPVNYGNIFIYKNNFRVMPYGLTDYDLFSLNVRKTQGYSRYLGTRELLGFIEIEDRTNTFFREASSRDSGFVNNVYMNELQNLYMEFIHRPLESYMGLVSWGEFNIDKNSKETKIVYFDDAENDETEKFKKYISRKKKLIFFKNDLNLEDNKPEIKLDRIIESIPIKDKEKVAPLVKKVKKQVEKLKKENQEQIKIVQTKNKNINILENQNKRLSESLRPYETYIEQIKHHFTHLAGNLKQDVFDLNSVYKAVNSNDLKETLQFVMENLKTYSDQMEGFRFILSETCYDMNSAVEKLNLIDFFKLLTDHKNKNQSSLKVILEDNCDNSESWVINAKVLDVNMLFDNFYINAIEHGAELMSITFENDRLLIFSDSEIIPEKFINNIFEFGFSTKESGTGIGLFQISEFFYKYNFKITASNLNNGVEFEVLKK